MTIEATDIAIILVSTAACAYCFVLSRRLKALQNTKDGLGATIMAMSKSIAAMSSSTKETRSQVGEMAAQLATQLEDAKQTCTRLEQLKAELENTQKETVDQVTASQAELSTMLRIILDQSKTRVMEINSAMNQLRELTEADEDYRPLTRSGGT